MAPHAQFLSASGRFVSLSFLFLILVAPRPAVADVRLPGIFGSHMVLERDTKLPVWGWANAGEAVTVKLGEHTVRTTADADGKWRVALDPVKLAAAPLTLTVTGHNRLTFEDVLVGDVWICSGQSNMEFSFRWGAHNAAAEILKADEPQLRLFTVAKRISLEPVTEVHGEWKVCSPATMADFSSVGYFFGRELSHSLNRPIGLISAPWSGVPAQAFISLSALQKNPPFAHYISHYHYIADTFPKAQAAYPATLAVFWAQTKQWNESVAPTYDAKLKEWQKAADQAKASGKPAPPKPEPSTPKPRYPNGPYVEPATPTVLYNGMIAPLIPYALKGVIWYQGESNGGPIAYGNGMIFADESNAYKGGEYQTLFPRLIADWRERWHQGDFPFLYVQLANYTKGQIKPSEGGWAYLREAQLKTLALANTGIAVTIDIGDAKDIHPKDKLDVGLRLALAAKHVAYRQDLVYSGPIYDAMKIETNTIRLTFKHTGGGLQIRVPPWTPTGTQQPAPTELTGFAIAGADRNWVWAKAQIDGNTVVVSSDQVPLPVAVRYGWASNPSCDLYNKEGLPASPFRTDDWPK
jgi:sialate O-acetylesterase